MFTWISKLFRAYFLIVGFLVSLLMISFLYLSKEKIIPASVQGDVVLHFKLDGEIVDYKQNYFNIKDILSGTLQNKYYLLDIKNSLERASHDNNVKALFLELGSYTSSYALTSEFRSLLKEFKKSGKKLYVWFGTADTSKYYLASIADKIYMPSSGELELLGPSFSFAYIGKALDKVGIKAEVIKSGSYKSLFEWLVSNKMSSNTRSMFSSLEKDLRTSLVDDISAERRSKNKNEVYKWFKKSFYGAEEALSLNMVDSLAYLHSLKKQLPKDYNSDLYSWDDYETKNFSALSLNTSKSGIALIEMIGEIKDDSGLDSSAEIVSYQKLEKELQWAHDSDNIKSVLIRISSPGGSALASDLIWAMVTDLRKKKPVIVSMGSVAASGGYYIASAATKIFSYKTTLTGSIGVITARPSLKEFSKLYGLNFITITGSDRKSFLNPGEDMSAEDRAILQSRVNRTYDEFVRKVSLGRSLSKSKVAKLAEGRVWSGAQALNNNLVDSIGGFSESLAETKLQGGFSETDEVDIIRWKPEVNSVYDFIKSFRNLKYSLFSTLFDFKMYTQGRFAVFKNL